MRTLFRLTGIPQTDDFTIRETNPFIPLEDGILGISVSGTEVVGRNFFPFTLLRMDLRSTARTESNPSIADEHLIAVIHPKRKVTATELRNTQTIDHLIEYCKRVSCKSKQTA